VEIGGGKGMGMFWGCHGRELNRNLEKKKNHRSQLKNKKKNLPEGSLGQGNMSDELNTNIVGDDMLVLHVLRQPPARRLTRQRQGLQ